jgi:hypothetical protein
VLGSPLERDACGALSLAITPARTTR